MTGYRRRSPPGTRRSWSTGCPRPRRSGLASPAAPRVPGRRERGWPRRGPRPERGARRRRAAASRPAGRCRRRTILTGRGSRGREASACAARRVQPGRGVWAGTACHFAEIRSRVSRSWPPVQVGMLSWWPWARSARAPGWRWSIGSPLPGAGASSSPRCSRPAIASSGSPTHPPRRVLVRGRAARGSAGALLRPGHDRATRSASSPRQASSTPSGRRSTRSGRKDSTASSSWVTNTTAPS